MGSIRNDTRLIWGAILIVGAALLMPWWSCSPAFADQYTVDDVAEMIRALPADPRNYSPDDRSTVESIEAAYESLSADDQSKLDKMGSHPKTDQPLGRVLEVAVWTIWSFDVPDNSTILPDNVYDASTTPALASAYSKGKSTSPRDKPWSVKAIEVVDGKAYATLTVQSDSYSDVMMNGTTYPRTNASGNCEFAGIPIQLNTTFYFAGVSTIMPYPIAFSLETSIDESAAAGTFIVTFTDGQGNVLDEQEVEYGQAAIPPEGFERQGYDFAGWDSDFSFITSDLEVQALWVKNNETAVNELRAKIAEIANPGSLVGKTDDAVVAEARALYAEMTDEQRALIPADDRLKLVQAMIAVLPRDPYAVTVDHEGLITQAVLAYDALPEELQKQLDTEALMESRSYGRYLESAAWAFDSLNEIDNSTSLANGTYSSESSGIMSSSSRGKSTSSRDTKFTVTSIKVTDGRVIATIESTAKTYESIHLGGKEYPNKESDPNKNSRFEVPIDLNSTFHFSAKARQATGETDAIAYEMTVSADEGSMKPDSQEGSGAGDNSGSDNKSSGTKDSSSSGDSKSKGSKSTTSGALVAKGSNTARKLTASTSTGTRAASSSGNLSSLLRKSSTSTQAAKKNTSKSGSSTESGSSTNSGLGSDLSDDGSISEIGLAGGGDTAQIDVNLNLAPAVAGGSALSVALGILAFVLRFVRREGLLLPF